jgi:uncharacterized protein
MPDALVQAFQTEGLVLLVCTVVVAGLVRGFAGFGSAMIIMPMAASVLTPVAALIFLTCVELVGPLPNLPSAWREGRPREVGLMMIGALVALPLGVWCLSLIDPLVFGWVVSGAVVILLLLIVSGWRYRGRLTRGLVVATGGLGGFMTGFAGIAGPPVIMLYMASLLPARVIRANFLLYLLAIDLLLFPVLWLGGLWVREAAILGVVAAAPYVLANIAGARLFTPGSEVVFRRVAYLVIASSAILGLPIWKG